VRFGVRCRWVVVSVPCTRCQLSDGVVDTRFRASDDHRAAAVIDDVDRDLPTDAGNAADNNAFLASKCIFGVPSRFS
jgi:hypothetical protein